MTICVLGAGACGLVATKKLLDAGLEPVTYEKNAELGGNWLYGSPGPSPRLRAAVADRQDTHYYNYLPSRRHHLEVDYLLYERDLRKLLRLVEDRRKAA